jgi:two-component system, OmpR family, KDP operon response regulator KdpE
VPATTILIISGEKRLRTVLQSVLNKEGYGTIDTASVSAASSLLRNREPDLILLDVDKQDDVPRHCETLRLCFLGGLVVLSPVDQERDKVLVLDAGADEFLVKPFGMQELLARIRVLTRRLDRHMQPSIVETADLRIDLESRVITVQGKRVYVPPKEFEVLQALVLARGKPVASESLLRVVWNGKIRDSQNVRVAIHELRQRIEPQPSKPRYICTEPRFGYRFVLPV